MDAHAISFGPFRLLAAQRLLLEGDNPVRLGSRAFDILAALVERAGEVVGKKELIARAWPKTFVEDANLKIQVSALRRALGDGQGGHRYVVTVPGRGYNFVAPVSLEKSPQVPRPPTIAPAGVHNLPPAVTRMIGRDDAVTALVSRLSSHRLVTIVGPGGIGKTTVALAVAERMIASYEDGVWLVDLAPLSDPRLVSSTVATALGLGIRPEDPLNGLVAGLRDKRMLLLLDNCERVIDKAASLVTAVLSGAPGVNILETSRERLAIQGEREYRLGPLSIPQASFELTAAEAVAFPAVQLFVERATEIVDDFVLTDANAPAVAEICRRLDGLPLAIEFAAAHVAVLGVKGLAARLDDSLPLLGTRHRAATPRHRTMRAVVDWSYGLLSEFEQRFFRALGIFAGGFTVEAAGAVAIDAANTRVDAIDCLADLLAKSLVVADVSGTEPRFRLLDTTRAYTIEKLDERGEREQIARHHAEYYRKLFERAEDEAAVRSTGEWLAAYAREIDNLRVALDWTLSPRGDEAIGIALTVASVPLWLRLSLLGECRERADRALAAIDRVADPEPGTEMLLRAALGMCLMYTRGPVGEAESIWGRVLELAERIGDTGYQLRALYGLWLYKFLICEFRVALELSEKFRQVAEHRAITAEIPTADRMASITLHFLGDQAPACIYAERALSAPVLGNRNFRTTHYGTDQRVGPSVFLARALWLRGLPDQAMKTVLANVEEAANVGHANSTCIALADGACLISILVDDIAGAERFAAMLADCAEKHALGVWRTYALAVRGRLLIRRDPSEGARLLRSALTELQKAPYDVRFTLYSAWLAETLDKAGRPSEALVAVDNALRRAESTDERWFFPELLRVRGNLMIQEGTSGATEAASDCFSRSLNWAQKQKVLSWELRTTMDLTRLRLADIGLAQARLLLQSVYGRFSEGFQTGDLVAARRLLAELE
jgi:predicted ATPase/DNA-binding winged helix-turn-helix (wHTH) protein